MGMAEYRRSDDELPFGGDATGPNPTDRGKKGTKRSLLTEGNGVPIAVVVAGANRHDMKLLADTIDAVVVERPEPTEDNPQHLCADKGYDYPECRLQARERNYNPHIRSRGEERREKTNNPSYRPRRWVIEVCHSWLNHFRKILVRFEKRVSNHLGLLQFAFAHIVLSRAGVLR